MRSFITILFIIILMSFQAQGQSYFNRVYNYLGTSSYNNAASSSYEYSNGDFLISGQKYYSFSFGALCFIRINSIGDTLYYKRYSKPYCRYYGGASGSLIKCYDGHLAQCGVFVDSSGNFDGLLVKLTEDGDTLWTKTYGGPNFDNANVVCQTPDSGFVLMGVTQSFGPGTASNFYLVKTDKNGNQQWQQVYGTTAPEDCVSGQITLDGGFIMSGIRNSALYIIKADSNGNFEWDRQFTGTAGTGFIKQSADSTYILVGSQLVSGFSYQAYMTKLTKTGSTIWQKTYGTVTRDEQFYTVPLILSDGSIVCAGQSSTTNNWGLLIKTDSGGNQQWMRNYYANPSNNSYVYDLKATSDNGFIMVGSGNITGQDAWVVKTDEYGCEVSNCNVGVNEVEITDDKLSLYPNPASTTITLELTNENINDCTIEIIDVLGKVQKVQINGSVLDVSELSPGLYFVSLLSNDGLIRISKKFVKE